MTDVIDTMNALGFRASREQLHALLAHLTKSRASPMQTVEQLAELERREREARNLASRTKKASLGTTKPSADYDWSYPKRADQAVYEELSSLDFVRKRRNVLFRGPAGTGKTTLAKNLGLRALEAGMSVVFTKSLSPQWSAASVATPAWTCSSATNSDTSPSTLAPPTCSSRSSAVGTKLPQRSSRRICPSRTG